MDLRRYRNLPTKLKQHILSFLDYLLDDKLKVAKSNLRSTVYPSFDTVYFKGFHFSPLKGTKKLGTISINYHSFKNYSIKSNKINTGNIHCLDGQTNYKLYINDVKFLNFIVDLQNLIIDENNQGRLHPELISYQFKPCIHADVFSNLYIFIHLIINGKHVNLSEPTNSSFQDYKRLLDDKELNLEFVFALIPYLIVDHVKKVITLDFLVPMSVCNYY
jgi:hypothetical protein